MMNKNLENALIYQIYPASFFDSDGDGIGDFNGIIEKLPYLKKLNVDFLWLNPIFMSPFMDGGYDVSDYSSINPVFGTLGDLKKLLTMAHLCNLRIIMDFVPGHTSIKHRWFKESCKANKNKYSDYYVWTNHWSEGGKGTLNGISERNGCVLTNYYSFQPSLNYGYEVLEEPWQIHYKDERLKPLRDEICSLMKQWLEFGFDGFRIDLAASLVKNRKTEEPLIWLWNKIIKNVRSVKEEAIFIAEWGDPALSVGKCGFDIDYLNHENPQYNELIRNEEGSNILRCIEKGHSFFNKEGKGTFENFQKLADELDNAISENGYFSFPSGYHDIPRVSIGRSLDQLKLFYVFMFTYKFIPQLYYGDEIALSYNKDVNKDGGYERTGARTPMQWNDQKNKGFSTGDDLYLPVNNIEGEDVEHQLNDKDSLLNLIIRLSLLRRTNRSFYITSDINVIENGYPLIFERTAKDNKFIVLINPSKQTYERTINYAEIVESNNCNFKNDLVILKGESFAILRK